MRFIDKLTQIFRLSQKGGDIFEAIDCGKEVSLELVQSARPLFIAIEFTRKPRPMLVVVPGEDRAHVVERSLASLIGRERVKFLPERKYHPWQQKQDSAQCIAQRMEALHALKVGANGIVVTTACAMSRGLLDSGVQAYESLRLACGEEVPFETLSQTLVAKGYERYEKLEGPGTFRITGDTLDVWPATLKHPIRAEFFGDEIDGLRSIIAATGQSVTDLDCVDIFPCVERDVFDGASFEKDDSAQIARKQEEEREYESFEYERKRYGEAAIDPKRKQSVEAPKTFLPFEWASPDTTVILFEPRGLIDDSLRYCDEVISEGRASGYINTAALGKRLEAYLTPATKFNFSRFPQISLYSISIAGTSGSLSLEASRPNVSGQEERLFAYIRSAVLSKQMIFFAVPDRSLRESLKLSFVDNGITFGDCSAYGLDEGLVSFEGKFNRGVVYFVDEEIGAGSAFPDLNLCIISVADLYSGKAAQRSARKIDITDITFPFVPGDYVVHSVHGIAHFNSIVRREMNGIERDYLFLEYAEGDKLFVPVDHLDRVTRYVGPDGSEPRLTRLHTSDWKRVIGKARKSAKQLAFDLVDLYSRRASATGFAYPPDTVAQREMESDFCYEPTEDQYNAIMDVKIDMESSKPMDRLICGDVGFGKTEVALRAAFKATQSNKQVMILCPTTILAQQHFTTFNERFAPYGINVEILSRFRTKAEQKKALEGFASGDVHVLIGTHRLLSRDVNPKDLGLVIIDEEQRFGVGHKEQLKNLRDQIDVLTLSATPIPRTMQMATSGVRDMSLINTAPESRSPVKVHVGEWDEDIVAKAIRRELARKGQVYYVSNRVMTIEQAMERVLGAVPEARVGVAHGQMSERALEAVMEDFAAGEIDVLIATTIIESGIDNPHTNTLIIEDSQRLGLAQLYQLKGRVGRSRTQAYAYFLFPPDASLTEDAQRRLLAIDEHQELGSGVKIAMRDLEIRGAGSLMGAEQHGNLASVGFDLFTQMLGEAVNEARGETEEAKTETIIDIPVHMYFPEEYIPEIDKRVLWYRRFAAVTNLPDLVAFESKLVKEQGPLPDPARNLINRARLRLLAEELKITNITLTGSRLNFTPVDWARNLKARSALAQLGGVYSVKAKKAILPISNKDEALVCGIQLLDAVLVATAE